MFAKIGWWDPRKAKKQRDQREQEGGLTETAKEIRQALIDLPQKELKPLQVELWRKEENERAWGRQYRREQRWGWLGPFGQRVQSLGALIAVLLLVYWLVDHFWFQ